MLKGKLEIFVIGVTCVCAVAVLAVAGLTFVPFGPMSFESIVVSPNPVCPSEQIGARVRYTLDEEDFPMIRRLDIKSEWRAVDVENRPVGAALPAAEVELPSDLLQPGLTDRESRVVRVAPQDPGTWRLVTTSTARGTRYGWPVAQDVVIEAAEGTEVLPADHSNCLEGGRS